MKKMIAGAFRLVGLHLQKHHDPYRDALRLLGSDLRNVVDGGAHKGLVTMKLLETFPNATVHAFEPQDEQSRVLAEKYAGNPRVKLNKFALGRDEGVAQFNINKDCFSSLLKTLTPSQMGATGKTQEVRLTTLDTWSAESRVIPELIKLDLQGYELPCLEGARSILEGGVKGIITEINFRQRYEGMCLLHEVSTFLHGRGFQFYRAYEIWGGEHGEWLQGDALFVRKELLAPKN